jgi:hypothetical protein
MNWWAVFQLFVLFAVICWPIAAWFILSGRYSRDMARASRNWPTVPGKVLASEVLRSLPLTAQNSLDYTYTPTIRYAFEVGGKAYEGDTIQFGLVSGKNPILEEAVLKPYPVGAKVNVHYDPANPKNSVLDTSLRSGSGRLWAGWIMIAVPFLLILVLWWVRRRAG